MDRIEGFEVLEDQLLLARATFSALGPEPTLDPSKLAVVDDDEATGQQGMPALPSRPGVGHAIRSGGQAAGQTGGRSWQAAGHPQLGRAAAGIGFRLDRIGHQGLAGDPLQAFVGQEGLLDQPVFQRVEADDRQQAAGP